MSWNDPELWLDTFRVMWALIVGSGLWKYALPLFVMLIASLFISAQDYKTSKQQKKVYKHNKGYNTSKH